MPHEAVESGRARRTAPSRVRGAGTPGTPGDRAWRECGAGAGQMQLVEAPGPPDHEPARLVVPGGRRAAAGGSTMTACGCRDRRGSCTVRSTTSRSSPTGTAGGRGRLRTLVTSRVGDHQVARRRPAARRAGAAGPRSGRCTVTDPWVLRREIVAVAARCAVGSCRRRVRAGTRPCAEWNASGPACRR